MIQIVIDLIFIIELSSFFKNDSTLIVPFLYLQKGFLKTFMLLRKEDYNSTSVELFLKSGMILK